LQLFATLSIFACKFYCIFIKYCAKCKSVIIKNTTKLFQFSSILFDFIKKIIWRISCVSMLSMAKQLVCKLEVLQPQPSMRPFLLKKCLEIF